jgi:hypothetical protein
MTGNESGGYPHADRYVLNAAVQHIGCQTQAGLFVEFDDGHDVWALILDPLLVATQPKSLTGYGEPTSPHRCSTTGHIK